jgi:hypothetical protein
LKYYIARSKSARFVVQESLRARAHLNPMPVPVAPSSFRNLVESRVACPLCSSGNIDYEFMLDRTAFLLCRMCGLLFVSPRGDYVPQQVLLDAPLEAAVAEVAAVAERIVGRRGRTVVLAPVSNRTIRELPVRAPSELVPGECYDTVVVAGMLERDEDPIALLQHLESHLAEDGCLVLLAPSTRSALAKSQRANWLALRSKARFYFSPDLLQLLATRCGFGDFVTFSDPRDLSDAPSDAVKTWFRSNSALVCRRSPAREARLLSVIFPVYNEAELVELSLQRVLEKEIPGVDIEVVIVESNSTDGSREIVERYRDHPRVRLILEDRPSGKGHAVRTGLAHATGEVVLFQDADLEYDINDYDILVAPLFELKRNFVLGSRHNPGGAAWKIRTFADQPVVAMVTNFAHLVLLTMFNTLYAQRLADPFTMYKVFRRDCLHGLTFECNRFDFDYEITIKLLRKGYQPVEIPINYLSRSFKEGKKVSFFGDPPTWIRAMLKMRRVKLYPTLSS